MKTALLEYFVTKEKTYLFIVRPESEDHIVKTIPKGMNFWKEAQKNLFAQLAKVQPSKAHRIEKELNAFYALGKDLIEPVLEVLRDRELLYIVPHSFLHYLPFHGMRITLDNEEFHLIEKFKIVYLPSATVLKFLQRKNPYRYKKNKIMKPLIMGTWGGG